MKNKYNKLYKGLFNQEKKSLINNNHSSQSNSNIKTNDNSEVKPTNSSTNEKPDLNQSIYHDSSIRRRNNYQQTIIFSSSLSKIRKNIKSDNFFLIKRQCITDVFNNDLEYNGNLFESEISSLFDERIKKENISFMKKNITKVKNVSTSMVVDQSMMNVNMNINANIRRKDSCFYKLNLEEGDFYVSDECDLSSQSREGSYEREETKIKNNYFKILNN